MADYIGRLYPNDPYAEMEILCIDCLKFENDESRHQIKKCKDYLSQIKSGLTRYSFRGKVVYYNNASWYLGTANNIFEFVENMKQALDDVRKEMELDA